MSNAETRRPVSDHYDAVASHYHELFERDTLYDTSGSYPANYFCLQLILNSFITTGIQRVIEVGVGEGTPLVTLGKAGVDVWGFDISRGMVEKAKQTMQENDMNPEHVFWGDIQDPNTYVQALSHGLFDGLIATTVMPHIENDDMVIENMSTMIRPGGKVFIGFRNKLFSLFTFNRYTVDFILDDLLRDVSSEVKAIVAKDLESRLRIDMPLPRITVPGSSAPGIEGILSKFHNPFEVVELFKRHNFEDIRLRWFHYHPAMPYLEEEVPELFRKEAVRLEHEPSNWRGYFLSSIFVVEAVKTG